MSNLFNVFPPYLILLTLILVIIPTIIAIILRHSLYSHLINSANKISWLSVGEIRGRQPAIVEKIENRFRQASQQLEQVNTIALIDGLYSQERLEFFGISLRCEQWDYFCQSLPNLLLSFGLLGTFIGISSNLYNLSQTINFEQNVSGVNELVNQLQQPLQNMGIAFSTSLVAIFCSSILIIVNLRCNTNFAKSLLISSLEDYLDNIFKIEIDGYSRLDKAVDRMVKQQAEFLHRFHEKVGQVLENTIGNAANQMVTANQGFQNNVDNMVSRFNDISSSLSGSINSFQESTFTLKEQIQTVTKIVPQLEANAKTYLQASQTIKQSKFAECIETFIASSDKIAVGAERYVYASQLAQEVQSELQQVSNTIKDGALSFHQSTDKFQQNINNIQDQIAKIEKITPQFTEFSTQLEISSEYFFKAAEKIESSKFSEHIESVTQDLATTQKSFFQSTEFLGNQVNKISDNYQQVTELAQQVYTHLQKASSNLQDSANSFTEAASTFKESDFANQLVNATQELITIPQQFNNSTLILHQSANALERAIDNINISTQKTNKLIHQVVNVNQHSTKLLEINANKNQQEIESFNKIQSELNSIVTTLEKHKEQVSLSMTNFGERILTSFEQQANNNVTELQKLTTEINNNLQSFQKSHQEITKFIDLLEKYLNYFNLANSQLSQLITNSEQQTKQVNSNLSGIGLISDRFLLVNFLINLRENLARIQKIINTTRAIIIFGNSLIVP